MDTTQKIKKPMTKDEVMLFVNLVANFPTVTSKETNAANNKLKEETWFKLTETFNSKCGSIPRTKEQLKLKWDNLKKAARKRTQLIRLNMMKTGGGKPDFIQPDETLDKVASMMGSTCTGFAVPFGGDGVNIDVFLEDGAIEQDINSDVIQEFDISNTPALPQEPETGLLPERNIPKKRKINFSSPDSAEHSKTKFLYGMPTMSKTLQNKGRKKTNDDGRLQKNLAIANYFTKMTEKTELEILLLKKQLENKENTN